MASTDKDYSESLKGQVAVVTGAGAGIGREITERLAALGASVAAIDINTKDADEAIATIRQGGGYGCSYQCDVSDSGQVTETFSKIQEELGNVDILVNNAGVVSSPGLPFTNNTEADWDRTFAINVKSITFTAKAVAEGMMARGNGRIINISSITGVIAAPFMPPYSVSKTAANGLTRVLARDFAPYGVTVNAICPGFIWSPLWEDLGNVMVEASGGDQGKSGREVFNGRIESLVPMKREQHAWEIASTVSFLCSEGARNITGQIISVDGGITI